MAIYMEEPISEMPDDWYDGLYLLGGLSPHPNYGVIELVDLSLRAVEEVLVHFERHFSL